jgi:5'-nucleotidase
MDRPPLDLSRARILISNDDSIHATGIKVLEAVARTLTDDVWVCAPETEQSGASHSLTIHRPLRMRTYDDRHFSVDGTPTDCVMLAMSHLLKDHRPDLVLWRWRPHCWACAPSPSAKGWRRARPCRSPRRKRWRLA